MNFDDRFFFGSGKRHRCKHERHDQRSELKLGVCPDPYCEKYIQDKLIEHSFIDPNNTDINFTLFNSGLKVRLDASRYNVVVWYSKEYRDGNHTWWIWERQL